MVGDGLQIFFDLSPDSECAPALREIFSLPEPILGRPRKRSPNYYILQKMDETLEQLDPSQVVSSVTGLFLRAYSDDDVSPADFRKLLRPQIFQLINKDNNFYYSLLERFEANVQVIHFTKLKAKLLKGTSISTHRPIDILCPAEKADTWKSAGLPEENIVPLEIIEQDVTAVLARCSWTCLLRRWTEFQRLKKRYRKPLS